MDSKRFIERNIDGRVVGVYVYDPLASEVKGEIVVWPLWSGKCSRNICEPSPATGDTRPSVAGYDKVCIGAGTVEGALCVDTLLLTATAQGRTFVYICRG